MIAAMLDGHSSPGSLVDSDDLLAAPKYSRGRSIPSHNGQNNQMIPDDADDVGPVGLGPFSPQPAALFLLERQSAVGRTQGFACCGLKMVVAQAKLAESKRLEQPELQRQELREHLRLHEHAFPCCSMVSMYRTCTYMDRIIPQSFQLSVRLLALWR